MSYDKALFEAIQSLTGNNLIDQIMLFSAEYLVILVPLTLIYLWLKGRKGKEDSSIIFLATVTGIITSYLLSLLYSHQNPSVVYQEVLAQADPSENAFPSQHTATVFATAFAAFAKKRKNTGILLISAAILTGFSRVYIGEHWPVDILGSMIAASAGLIILSIQDGILEFAKPVFEFSEKIERRLKSLVSGF